MSETKEYQKDLLEKKATQLYELLDLLKKKSRDDPLAVDAINTVKTSLRSTFIDYKARTQRLEDVQNQNSGLKDKVKALSSDNVELSSVKSSLESQVRKLNSDLGKQKEEFGSLKEEYNSKTAYCSRIEKDKSGVEQSLSSEVSTRKEIEKSLEQTSKRVGELETSLASEKESFKELTTKLKRTAGTLHQKVDVVMKFLEKSYGFNTTEYTNLSQEQKVEYAFQKLLETGANLRKEEETEKAELYRILQITKNPQTNGGRTALKAREVLKV